MAPTVYRYYRVAYARLPSHSSELTKLNLELKFIEFPEHEHLYIDPFV